MTKPRGAAQRATEVDLRLEREYPDAKCALDFRSPYELLVATILAAQCTDVRVNMVTPKFFERYPTSADLAVADPEEVEVLIKSTGFYHAKTRNLLGMAQKLEQQFGGVVPKDLADLVTMPGVGRKTGNVIRSVAYGLPGLPVDTHVTRLSKRLGLTNETDAVKIEFDLDKLIPPERNGMFSIRLIDHGRKICHARKPECEACILVDICPSAGEFITISKATKTKKSASKNVPAKRQRPGAQRGTRSQARAQQRKGPR